MSAIRHRRRPASGAPSPRRAARALVAAALLGAALLASLPRGAHAGRAPGVPRPLAPARASDDTLVRGLMVPPEPYRPKEFAFIHDQGVFHLFYMRHDTWEPDDATEIDIGHAISTDLVNWTQLDSVMAVQPGTWDSSHVWAPTIIKRDDTWYMYYAGVGDVPYPWAWYQQIGVATSTDLVNWTRYPEPVYGGNQVPWAFADSSQFDGAQFRDPFVMEDPDSAGQYLMYYVTEPASARGQLIVGVARGDGGLSPWQDVGPLWCTDSAHYWGWCESPHVVQHDGLWYLFATTPSGHPIGFRVASSPVADSSDWAGKYRLYDFAGGSTRNSDAWFASEVLSFDGHDYFAYIDSDLEAIGIEEMHWGSPPDFFSLGPPLTAGVALEAARLRPGLRLVGRARRGSGATLGLTLPAPAEVRVDLFDVMGRRVRTLRPGTLGAGETLVRWDGRGEDGTVVPCAIYFARAASATGHWTARLPLTD